MKSKKEGVDGEPRISAAVDKRRVSLYPSPQFKSETDEAEIKPFHAPYRERGR